MHRRRAFSLNELLVVFTVTAVLLAVAVGILAVLLRTEQTGRQQDRQTVVLDRLAVQFRADAHAAERFAPEAPASDSWLFNLGAGRVATYRATGQAVQRDETVAGRPVRHETYPLPPGCSVRPKLSDDRSLASLIVTPAESDTLGRHACASTPRWGWIAAWSAPKAETADMRRPGSNRPSVAGPHALERCVPDRRVPDRGVIMVVVLVCLGVMTLMFMALARQAGLVHRRAEVSQRSLQAQWLAEAGVQRAAARLAADPAYRGETWRLAAQDLGGRDEAEIRIKVEKRAGPAGRSTIRVEADYPPAADLRCRQVEEIMVDSSTVNAAK